MDPSAKQQLDYELKNRFYYIDYPESVTEGWWRDRLGTEHFMGDMGLDHLKASIRLVEKDIKAFTESRGHPKSLPKIFHLLEPLATKKLAELNLAFRRKVDS